MSIKEKFNKLLELVLLGTREGTIQWENTANEEEFSTDLNAGSIFVSRRFVQSDDIPDSSDWQYRATLYSHSGDVADEYEEWGGTLKDLYAEARRAARKTNQMLDSLLEELDSDRITLGAN